MRWIAGLLVVGWMGVAAPAGAQSLADMSPACQQMVKAYVAASQRGDGDGALAQQQAIRKAGGCGVIDGEQARPADGDQRFPTRGSRPLTEATVGACHQSPAECAERMRQLEQGTSNAAKAQLMMDAIGQGLALGQALAGAVQAAVPKGTGTTQRGAFEDCKNLNAAAGNYKGAALCGTRATDMNSLGGPIIRNGIGQGSPDASRK